jgi:hypothetical protein
MAAKEFDPLNAELAAANSEVEKREPALYPRVAFTLAPDDVYKKTLQSLIAMERSIAKVEKAEEIFEISKDIAWIARQS